MNRLHFWQDKRDQSRNDLSLLQIEYSAYVAGQEWEEAERKLGQMKRKLEAVRWAENVINSIHNKTRG